MTKRVIILCLILLVLLSTSAFSLVVLKPNQSMTFACPNGAFITSNPSPRTITITCRVWLTNPTNPRK